MTASRLRTVAAASFTAGCLALMGGCGPSGTVTRAPDFMLTDASGNRFYLSAQSGKVVLLNFWSVYCVPCLREMPELEKLWREWRERGVVVVGVCVDPGQGDNLGIYLMRTGVTYATLVDNGKVKAAYGVQAVPTTVLVDSRGMIGERIEGYEPGYEKRYAAILEQLVKGQTHAR